MTSYEELLSIMEDLSGISLNVQYDGAFNGGINGRMNTKADLVKQNGSREGLDELTAKAEEKGVPLYFGVALSKVYESGNGFMSSRHSGIFPMRPHSNTGIILLWEYRAERCMTAFPTTGIIPWRHPI